MRFLVTVVMSVVIPLGACGFDPQVPSGKIACTGDDGCPVGYRCFESLNTRRCCRHDECPRPVNRDAAPDRPRDMATGLDTGSPEIGVRDMAGADLARDGGAPSDVPRDLPPGDAPVDAPAPDARPSDAAVPDRPPETAPPRDAAPDRPADANPAG